MPERKNPAKQFSEKKRSNPASKAATAGQRQANRQRQRALKESATRGLSGLDIPKNLNLREEDLHVRSAAPRMATRGGGRQGTGSSGPAEKLGPSARGQRRKAVGRTPKTKRPGR